MMDIGKALELLAECLSEIEHLKTLSYKSEDGRLWMNKVEVILKAAFGKDSDEYKELESPYVKVLSFDEGDRQEDYLSDLNLYGEAIKKIIQKYKILGIETKPAAMAEPKDTAELPVYLFDKMQFHPKIIDASRALFKDEHYAQAIFEAFKAVENFVQDKSDLNLHGTKLMETVFNEENPIIKVPEAGHYYKDVQRGFKHLFVGAAQAIRNPKAHKKIIQKDPYITLQYLGFFSFLLKRIDYWEVGIS